MATLNLNKKNKDIVTYLELCSKVAKLEKAIENIYEQLSDLWNELTIESFDEKINDYKARKKITSYRDE